MIFAQITPADAAQADSAVSVNSVWDFLVKGGPVMIPIGVCSLVALTVIVERLVSLRRRYVIPPGFVPGLKAILRNGDEDRTQAMQYCRDNDSPIARVFAAGIKHFGEPTELLEKHVEEAGARQVIKLRKYLRALGAMGSVATLLGLLGTILGLINAFQTVAASGEALGKTELLAKGIYEAMITTAAGLFVAIPVVLVHTWFNAKVESLVGEMDETTEAFLEDMMSGQVAPTVKSQPVSTVEPSLRAVATAG